MSTPAWSPEGDRLAYARRNARAGNGFAVEVLELATGRRRQITQGRRIEGSPTWAPDGRSLAFSGNLDDPSFDIYVTTLDGDPPRRITDGHSPAWSPEGQLAFVRIEEGLPRLYMINPAEAGAAAVSISGAGSAAEQDPSWAPDGGRLALSTLSSDGDWDIAIVDPDTGNRNVIDIPGTDERYPTWSPDGRWIAISRIESGRATIWLLDPRGTVERQVTTDQQFDLMPAWRPGGMSELDDVGRTDARQRGLFSTKVAPMGR